LLLEVSYGSADKPMVRVLKMARGIHCCHNFSLFPLPEQPLLYLEE